MQGGDDLEKLDPRGRTPLLLAIVLGRNECAISLLKHGANALFEHKSNWNGIKLIEKRLLLLFGDFAD